MSNHRIVASVSGEDAECVTARTAIALAHSLDAEVEFLHVIPDYRRFMGLGAGYGSDKLNALKIKQIERAGPARLKSIGLAESAAISATWCDEIGSTRDLLLTRSIDADLIIVDRRESSDASAVLPRGLAGDLATASAKPVVVTPGPTAFERLGSRVFVAWDGSKESQRAVMHALPLLRRADRVDALHLRDDSWAAMRPGELSRRLESYLSRHEVSAECREQTLNGTSTGKAVLVEAEEVGADLIVMGAYGHSRRHETVFGGVTAHMLEHATLPVFLSH